MEIIHCVETTNDMGVPLLKEIQIIDKFEYFNALASEGGRYEDNDFELSLRESEWNRYPINIGDWVYIPNSEWGGKIKKIVSTKSGSILLSGPNFRTNLNNLIVSPIFRATGTGSTVNIQGFDAYYEDTGDANRVLERVITKVPISSDSVTVKNSTAGFIDNYHVDPLDAGLNITVKMRFEQFVSAFEKLLISNDYHLRIQHQYFSNQGYRLISVSAKPIVDYSDSKYLNNDYRAIITSSIDEVSKRDYLIALGRGELTERDIVVFVADYETSSLHQVFTGNESSMDEILKHNFNHNAVIYDYPSVESLDDLIAGAKERFESEYLPKTDINFEIESSNFEFNLGDIVGGEDSITGAKIKARIVEKELNIENGQTTFKYKVGDIRI